MPRTRRLFCLYVLPSHTVHDAMLAALRTPPQHPSIPLEQQTRMNPGKAHFPQVPSHF